MYSRPARKRARLRRAAAAWPMPPRATPRSARENDGARPVHEDPPLRVEANGLRKHAALHVLAERDHVLRRVRVGHTRHVLLDDRPFVEIRRDVVSGRADQLDAALMDLRVGARP